jgi:hypothetical protein
MALIDTVFKAYTGHDFTSLKTVYGDNLTIIDGFAPYRWIGPNALDQWEPLTRPGILTLTLGKHGEMWKADGQAWGRVS